MHPRTLVYCLLVNISLLSTGVHQSTVYYCTLVYCLLVYTSLLSTSVHLSTVCWCTIVYCILVYTSLLSTGVHQYTVYWCTRSYTKYSSSYLYFLQFTPSSHMTQTLWVRQFIVRMQCFYNQIIEQSTPCLLQKMLSPSGAKPLNPWKQICILSCSSQYLTCSQCNCLN